jgi:hypothetical protein
MEQKTRVISYSNLMSKNSMSGMEKEKSLEGSRMWPAKCKFLNPESTFLLFDVLLNFALDPWRKRVQMLDSHPAFFLPIATTSNKNF